MFKPLQWIAKALGMDTKQATVPVMDGALKPNRALDEATVLLEMPGVAHVLQLQDRLLFASGDQVFVWDRVQAPQALTGLPGTGAVSALAINSAGLLAVGRDGDGVYLHALGSAPASARRIETPDAKQALGCVTALAFAGNERLLIANGSAVRAAANWKADLVAGGASGAVFEYALTEQHLQLCAQGLAYPNGLAVDCSGRVLVSEAWRYRVLRLPASGQGAVDYPIRDLPGYPAGLAVDCRGVLHLALFAPRSQLFEFILGEKAYLQRMVKEIPQSNWVCPTLRSGLGYQEPLQGGAIRQMGVHKAWAPTLSYGLVVEFDAQFHAVRSWHSRSDGHAHGTTTVRNVGDTLLVAATGDGKLLALSAA